MQNFECTNCGGKIFFANDFCLKCGSKTAFDPETIAMVSLSPIPETNTYQALNGDKNGPVRRYCANAAHNACNWLAEESSEEGFCAACELNDLIPNLGEPDSLEAWQDLERAKKRLIYSLLRFGLPTDATHLGKGRLTFNFVRGQMTGHLNGVITINITEADSVERERRRQYFDEPYRSLLGHLRHESGHFYWNVLIEGTDRIEEFRSLFGDERLDYSQALARHHDSGPAEGWQNLFVSAYASAHPWEDWAETWAHYIHMVDAVETAETEGIDPRAAGITFGFKWPFKKYDAYRAESFQSLQEHWIPLTVALNRLNRSMGHSDFYAFVTPAGAYKKLAFIHRAIRQSASWTKPG
ncbi:MAG: putative zinc-binding peptidase [Alphaproteobacteria bacterium]|nr:putative zinc-binding peptidase [Alphaproteobacteria bacterium]